MTASLHFGIKTESRDDGTFFAMAYTIDNSIMRVVARDAAEGFISRAAARSWADKCRKAQRRAAKA